MLAKSLDKLKPTDYGWFWTVAKYCLASILIAVPLYPKFPFFRVPGTFVSIRLEDLLIALATLIVLIPILLKQKSLFKNDIFKTIFLFLIIAFVSCLSAIFITRDVSVHIVILHWLRRVEYFIPFFLAFFIFRRKGAEMDFYLKILLIVILIVFAYGLGQRYLSWPIIITQNEEYAKGVALRWIPGSHINSTFAGHYDLATFLVLMIPIVVCGFFILKGIWSRIILASVFFSGLWLIVNSASRISLVSYLIASIFSLFLIKKYKAIPVIVVISLIFIGFSSNLLDRYQRLIDVSFKKIMEIKIMNNYRFETTVYAQDKPILERKQLEITPTPPPVFEDRSTNIRLNVEWPRAVRAFSKNPLLGTGYSSISLATDNDYLRALGEVGFLGFVSFSLIFVKLIEILIKAYRNYNIFSNIEKVFLAGFMGGLPGIIINAVFIDVFEASKFATIFWLTTGLVIGTIYKRLNGQKI